MAYDATQPVAGPGSPPVSAPIRENFLQIQNVLGVAPSATAVLALPKQPTFTIGAAATKIPALGLIHLNLTPVGNVGGGADTLMSHSLEASTLNAAGRHIIIIAWGSFAANANSKTIELLFGATVLTIRTHTQNGGGWRALAVVAYNGASAQVGYGEMFNVDGAATGVFGQSRTTPAETASGAITIAGRGTSGSSVTDDVRQLGMLILGG